MSRLDELIAELCPDGVEYKPLSEIATITRGGSLQKKDFTERGVPCIHYGQIYTNYGLFTDKTFTFVSETTALRQKKAVTGDIVMAVTSENIEDVCKCVVWLGEGDVAVSGHTAIIHHNQDAKYLAYYFHSSMFFAQKAKLAHGTKVIEVTPDKLNGVIVPVPPLEVQREIVRVLDNLTFLSAKLSTELSAEISARRKQYEYYRNQLLSSDKNGTEIQRIRLGEVCRFQNGFAFKSELFSDVGEPVLRITNIVNGRIIDDGLVYFQKSDYRENLDRYRIVKGDIVVAMSGATTGKIGCNHGDTIYYLNQRVGKFNPDEERLDNRFLYHWLSNRSEEIFRISSGTGAQPNLSSQKMMDFEISLPSLEHQKRIAYVLDNFDAICSDLNISLLAEIEARQKQYEYYRDGLLTFKEKA